MNLFCAQKLKLMNTSEYKLNTSTTSEMHVDTYKNAQQLFSSFLKPTC